MIHDDYTARSPSPPQDRRKRPRKTLPKTLYGTEDSGGDLAQDSWTLPNPPHDRDDGDYFPREAHRAQVRNSVPSDLYHDDHADHDSYRHQVRGQYTAKAEATSSTGRYKVCALFGRFTWRFEMLQP